MKDQIPQKKAQNAHFWSASKQSENLQFENLKCIRLTAQKCTLYSFDID